MTKAQGAVATMTKQLLLNPTELYQVSYSYSLHIVTITSSVRRNVWLPKITITYLNSVCFFKVDWTDNKDSRLLSVSSLFIFVDGSHRRLARLLMQLLLKRRKRKVFPRNVEVTEIFFDWACGGSQETEKVYISKSSGVRSDRKAFRSIRG